jgi:hypothetical protein
MSQQDQPQEKQPPKGRAARGKSPALEAFIHQRLPPQFTCEALLAVHEQVLALLWDQLAALMDHPAVRAVFTQAIQTARRSYPLAGQVQALETRLAFSALRAQSAQLDPLALDDALAVLAGEVEAVIVRLLGVELFLSLLGDIELDLLRRDADPPA